MAAPKGNKNAVGNNGGNPGYGQLEYIKKQVEKYSPDWWLMWKALMRGETKEDIKYAMTEFNKLQLKLIPQDITSGGEKLESSPIYNGKSNGE